MEYILSDLNDFFEIFGEQIVDDVEYKFSTFVVSCKINEGNLYFNTLTKELLFLSNEESIHDTDIKKNLIKRYFFAPKQKDETTFCDEIRSVYCMSRKEEKGYNSFWILPTTDCNARCFYCYELGQRKRSMTMDVAKKTSDFIIRNKVDGKIQLTWFGGEPLFNVNVINTICDELKNNNVLFYSTIITNGYLFDDLNIKKYKDEWNLDLVQITLDGTEKKYNKTKSYVNVTESAYQKVLKNIEVLLSFGVQVNIRLNVGFHNLKDLNLLVEELGERLNGTTGANIYVSPLFGDKFEQNKSRFEKLLVAVKKLEEKITLLGFTMENSLRGDFKVSNCMADSSSSIIIMPDGYLGKCTSFTDRNYVGNIFDEKLDMNMLAKFCEYRQKTEQCGGCPIYPDCIRLNMCERQKYCYKGFREKWLDDTKQAMVKEYNRFLKAKICKNNDELKKHENS